MNATFLPRRAVLSAGLVALAAPALAATERRLARPDGAVAYTVQGEGPAIVLIPSLGRGQEDFDGVAPLLLAAGFRLLRPEPRGIGGSAPIREGMTLYDLAADIAAMIDAEKAAPVLVAGHAFGNWVARVLAYDHPAMVRGVAMLAAVLGTDIDPEIRRSITASFDTDRTDEERLGHLRRAYFAPGNDASVWLAGWHKPVAEAQRRAQSATTDKAWLRAGERHPLLYLAAAQDAIAPPPDEARMRGALGPQTHLAVVEQAGHALLPEQPQATADALVAFARSLPVQTSPGVR